MIKGFQKDLIVYKGKEVNTMLRSMIRTSFLLVVLVCLAFAGNANAASMSIGYINETLGGSIIIGDKEFSGFTVGGIDPFQVLVDGYQEGNVVTITFGGSFITTGSADYQLTYIVHSLGTPIESIDQWFNLSSQGTGGIVNIGETVFDSQGGNNVAQSSVGFYLSGDYNDPPGEPAQGDQLVVDPALLTLWVTKDINLDAYTDGQVGATLIGQSFHQTSVPEPGILLLLGTGFAGLAFYARRKRK